eukprot:CAMPEP_0175993064 /NCGR_PEP_ID=MMETSP0108-20121206/53750_1 /TAXON_ID=195067 ORGANISM="Goniomonas pacifica, Strain CCMP1869" /NCGR_SAMPLE_ID=MMETSP0108 /ASSEMBLY_ACC=CAM_ASM_000204 /LENGTH=41 /DNA_ID= /DNA_START= /DNA_END= /DNA_ORIENTATION=
MNASRKTAAHSIGIADADNGQATGSLGHKAVAVADSNPCRD